MAKNPWPEQFRPKKAPGSAEVDLSRTADPLSAFNESMRVAVGMPAQQPPVMPRGESPGSVEISSEVDVSKGLSSVFPQSKELEELQQRLERRYRQPSETHIDPATGEIREYTRNPETGEGEWFHHGVMPPPKAPSDSPSESGSPAAGPVNWEAMDRQTREKYGLPAKQPLGDIPSGGTLPEEPPSSGTPFLPGMEPEPTPPSPPPEATPGDPAPGPPPVQSPPVQPAPVQPTLAPEEDSTPTPSPATPAPVPGAANAGAANAFRDLGSAVGYAFGSLGGPLGSSIGMAAGGMLGTVMGGGQVTGSEVAKTALGLAGGAIAGTAGRMVGSALGGLFGQGQEGGGGGEIEGGGGGAGGAVSVSGGGMEGEPGEMTRLLREISMNIKTMVNDGIAIRGVFRRAGGSVI